MYIHIYIYRNIQIHQYFALQHFIFCYICIITMETWSENNVCTVSAFPSNCTALHIRAIQFAIYTSIFSLSHSTTYSNGVWSYLPISVIMPRKYSRQLLQCSTLRAWPNDYIRMKLWGISTCPCPIPVDMYIAISRIGCCSFLWKFIDLMYSDSLIPTITKPTRVTSHSATLIDNIFCNNILNEQALSGILYTDISDHHPIFYIDHSLKKNFQRCIYHQEVIHTTKHR